MGRPRKDKSVARLDKTPKEPKWTLKEETKRAVIAILLFALAAFLILAAFQAAGVAGKFSYDSLTVLFGNGFFLAPILLALLGVLLLKAVRMNLILTRLTGGIFFFLSFLGLSSVLFGDGFAGWTGSMVALPFITYFDYYASLIFLGAILLISLVITLDSELLFSGHFWSGLFKRKQEEEKEEEVEAPLKLSPASLEVMTESNPATEEVKEEEPKRAVEERKEKGKDEGLFSSLNFLRKSKNGTFTPPPISLLEKESGKPGAGDIKANSNIIKRTLANFGINVEMDEVSIGPTVTRYALKPAEGIKLSRIVALQNDLSLALAAHPLRVEAPIPGKSLVGIEIPNKIKATIRLASLLSTGEFNESQHPLLASLGKDIAGQAHYANLAKAPHLLIAGATGSGKSVTIHAVINSLLYRNSPESLRFIMIDPKRVELTLYNKIPHLLTPVITDAKKAIMALKWAAKEMDRRYDILESESVRDIQSYHKNVLGPALSKLESKGNESGEESVELERMPYIVVIIDELADIMTSYPRELEAAVVRLAQMSRAVGIHLILSTQRPSVEVITGLIKANIPSRIALQVASQIDSRTILDMAGAEKLLGAGDMLYLSGDMSKPIRLQSAFITEDEVKRVVGYLADQYADSLPSELNLTTEETSKALFASDLGMDDNEDDDLYEDAREAVIQAGKASASYLQRKLKVGYARAARLLDMLEERGVIGPGEGAKPREVYGAAPSAGKEEEMF